MKKKYFIYLLLAILFGCKTGGQDSFLPPNLNQAVATAFSKMIADKQFTSQGGSTFSSGSGATFSDNSGTKFAFTNQSEFFAGTCSPVNSEVKIKGYAWSFAPAVCQLVNVGYYVQGGNYVDLGNFYFISTQKKDTGHIITFAFRGGQPPDGVYQIGTYQSLASGSIFRIAGYNSDGSSFGDEYSSLAGQITVNTDNGFHVSSRNLSAYRYQNYISLSIGCCSNN